jgi:hypothetical protein
MKLCYAGKAEQRSNSDSRLFIKFERYGKIALDVKKSLIGPINLACSANKNSFAQYLFRFTIVKSKTYKPVWDMKLVWWIFTWFNRREVENWVW